MQDDVETENWVEVHDDDYDSTYYYNELTEESVWEIPKSQWIKCFDQDYERYYHWHSESNESKWCEEENVDEDGIGWEEFFDELTNCFYYVHNESGESSWEIPEWSVEVDKESRTKYYYNNLTYESTWEKPTWSNTYQNGVLLNRCQENGEIPIIEENSESYVLLSPRSKKRIRKPNAPSPEQENLSNNNEFGSSPRNKRRRFPIGGNIPQLSSISSSNAMVNIPSGSPPIENLIEIEEIPELPYNSDYNNIDEDGYNSYNSNSDGSIII